MTLPDNPYDQSFFDGQSAHSLQSARVVLGKVFPLLRPRRVLDVGCGVGAWLRAALDFGAREVVGTDGDYVDRAALMVSPASFISADLAAERLGDVLGERAATPFDLVICMEVAEHLPHGRAASLVADLTSVGDVVLFSAAIPFQYGTQHINEQWPEFWSILFRAEGFACFDCLRSDLWADAAVEWWYAQNTFLFAREGSAAAASLPREAAQGRSLSVVHPENMLANLLGLPRRHRLAAAMEELEDLRGLVAANLRHDATLPPLAALDRAARAPDRRDVFPWTRTEIYQPEQTIADLSRQLGTTGEFLEVANQAHASAQKACVSAQEACASAQQACALEREARLAAELAAHREAALNREAQDGARRDAARAELAGERARAYAAAHLFAEARIAELNAADAAQRQGFAAARRDLIARSQAERQALLAEVEGLRDVLARQTAIMEQPAEQPGVSASAKRSQVGFGLRRIGRRLPGPARRMARDLVRLVSPAGELAPVAPAPSDDQPLPATAPLPEKPQIQCFGKFIGEVNWWTLAAAVTRLRRFSLFDAEDYLRRNADVTAAGVDPYTHFIQSGALEGRGGTDPVELARLMSGFVLFEHAVRALPPPVEDLADLPSLVADVGHVGIYVSSHGNIFMEELAEDLATDLRSVGVTVDLGDENAPIDGRPPLCLFVAPHEFFILGRGPEWVRDDVLSEGFMFGTEQVQTSWFSLALPFILMSRGMLDICSQTADLFQRTDMAALHLLPGARLRPHRLTERDRQHPLFRVLPQAAWDAPDPHRPFAERPIDIAFFGNTSPRRDQFFARNAAFLADYETFNYCRRPGRGPIQGESDDGALTRLAGHVSGHSKITLNIHREEFGYFEWHRMVRLGMCSGSLVVSDPCLPHPSFVANEHYLQERARHIPELLEWLLTTEDGGREAERIRANVDALISDNFETRRAVARTLRFLSTHRERGNEAGP